jgi:hypothetical protein
LSPGSKQTKTPAAIPSLTPRSTGSKPDFGMITAPATIRNGPQLPSGKHLCLPFATKGRTCSNGYNCTNAHMTMGKASMSDLNAIESWVTSTANVSWASGRPRKLAESAAATTPGTPPAAMAATAATQVSPPAAAGNQNGNLCPSNTSKDLFFASVLHR